VKLPGAPTDNKKVVDVRDAALIRLAGSDCALPPGTNKSGKSNKVIEVQIALLLSEWGSYFRLRQLVVLPESPLSAIDYQRYRLID
jgi:hypothetical protein